MFDANSRLLFHSGSCGTIAASFNLKVERTRAALMNMEVGLRNFIML